MTAIVSSGGGRASRRPCAPCRARLSPSMGTLPAPARRPCGARTGTAYRCSLPGLAGFTGVRRAGPDLRRRGRPSGGAAWTLEGDVGPASGGFRVQGTATSPPEHGRQF